MKSHVRIEYDAGLDPHVMMIGSLYLVHEDKLSSSESPLQLYVGFIGCMKNVFRCREETEVLRFWGMGMWPRFGCILLMLCELLLPAAQLLWVE